MIYVVEDEDNIRELIVYTLSNSGYEAIGFSAPTKFWPSFKNEKPDLLLLDIMLPEEDGISILKRIREDKTNNDIPIMMLTAKGSEYDKVVGLDSGADDYLPKPFGMMELVARVKALLRRNGTKKATEEKLSCGMVTLDERCHSVTSCGEEVDLTYKEFELLTLMMSNPGMVFTREKLLSRIWGYSFSGESRTVDVHVRTLRQKLGDGGEIIETVRGVGYKVQNTEKR